MMNLGAMVRREWDLFFQSKLDVWFSLFPALVYVGFYSLNMAGLVGDVAGVPYVRFVIPGIAAMTILSSASNAGTRTFNEGFSPTLRQVFSLPTTRSAYVMAKLLSTVAVALAQGVVFLVGGVALFGLPVSPVGLALGVVALGLTGLAATGYSLTEALLADPRQMGTYLVISNVVGQTLIWTSSVFYPLDTMPAVLKWIALVNPLTYGVEALRGSLLGVSAATLSLPAAWSGLVVFAVSLGVLAVGLLKSRAGRVL